jgi:hypothetical protein
MQQHTRGRRDLLRSLWQLEIDHEKGRGFVDGLLWSLCRRWRDEGGLKQLDEVAGWVIEQDLVATQPDDDLITEIDPPPS